MANYNSSFSAGNLIRTSNPTTNYYYTGATGSFYVGEGNDDAVTNRTLAKFDLSSIPSDATVTDATLTMSGITADHSSNARTIHAYRIKRTLVQSEATWNVYSTGNSWATAGGFTATDVYTTDTSSGTQPASPTVGVDSVVITMTPSEIQDLVDGTVTNNGFLIKVDTESDDEINYTTMVLDVNYTEAGGAVDNAMIAFNF